MKCTVCVTGYVTVHPPQHVAYMLGVSAGLLLWSRQGED